MGTHTNPRRCIPGFESSHRDDHDRGTRFSAEEVEMLVTRPLEYSFNGLTGVERVRSASAIGLSIVWVEFGWGTDIYRDRQIVQEKLSTAREQIVAGNPTMAPISSIMGEILLLGIRPALAQDEQNAQLQMAMRTFGEFTLRNRLRGIQGVAQVTVMGGMLKQYQVVTSPERLASQNITLAQLTEAIQKANVLAGGGLMVRDTEESILRISGQSLSLEDLQNTPILWREQRPVLVREVADVQFGGPVRRGDGGASVRNLQDGSIQGGQGVILAIQKQPGVDTIKLDHQIQRALDSIEKRAPTGNDSRKTLVPAIELYPSSRRERCRGGPGWSVVGGCHPIYLSMEFPSQRLFAHRDATFDPDDFPGLSSHGRDDQHHDSRWDRCCDR